MTARHAQIGLLLLLCGSLATHGWDLSQAGLVDRTGRLKCPDFLQFYTYGTLARTGQAGSLYDASAHQQVAAARVDPRMRLAGFLPNYSPVIAWLMAPLSVLGYLQAMAAWIALSILLYATAAWLLIAAVPLRSSRPTAWLAVAAWPAIFVVIRYGQIAAISLLLVAIAVRLHQRDRPLLAGAALGLLAYKPNLLVTPMAVLAFAGEWRLLSGAVIGASLETALAAASVGARVFGEYLHVLFSVAQQPDLVQSFPAESHSFSGAVRLLTHWPVVILPSALAALVIATWLAVAVWHSTADVRPRWSALVLAMLLASPHLLTYDLLLLAVPLILLASWRDQSPGPRDTWVVVSLVMLYAGAWPGTLVARIYGLQLSTIGMGLGLALLFEQSQHQLIGRQPENREVDGTAS